MNSWVCASTPTVTRTSTGWPDARARRERGQPGDLVERVDDDPADPGVEGRGRARRRDLLLPCRAIRSAGKPARSATASSPPVQTSRPRPSSATQRATAGAEERLAGVEDVGARRTRRAKSRQRGAEVGLVEHEGRRAVLGGEVADVVPADGQHAVAVARSTAAARARVQRVDVAGRTQPAPAPRADVAVQRRRPRCARTRRYIRSGRARRRAGRRPFASTIRVASTSQSRARCRSVGLLVAARQDPAGVVEPVVGAGQLLEVAGDPVRLAQLGRRGDHPRELAERPEQVALALVGEQRRVEVVAARRSPSSAALRSSEAIRACAYCT